VQLALRHARYLPPGSIGEILDVVKYLASASAS
jgi:hypothetical protein